MSDEVCDDCGQVHPGCSRHNNRGKPCGNRPKNGTTVCTAPTHGGRLPTVKAAAERNVAQQEARRRLDIIGVAPVDDVLGALSQLAGEVVAWKNVAGELVAELTEIRYAAEGPAGEQLDARVQVLERAMTECRRTLVDIAKLNIESRLARVSEQQMDVVIKMVNAALVAAGVTGSVADEARAAASDVGRRHLEVVRSA